MGIVVGKGSASGGTNVTCFVSLVFLAVFSLTVALPLGVPEAVYPKGPLSHSNVWWNKVVRQIRSRLSPIRRPHIFLIK